MKSSSHPYRRVTHDALGWRGTWLADEMLARYVDWREHADAVAEAYREWRDARLEEERLRFSSYVSALDQEEAAATAYACSIRAFQRWLSRSSRDSNSSIHI